MKRKLLILLSFCFCMASYGQVMPAPDSTFRFPSLYKSTIDKMMVLQNKDIVASGQFQITQNGPVFMMLLLDSNGALKSTLLRGGSGLGYIIYDFEIQNGNKIVCLSELTTTSASLVSGSDTKVFRLNANLTVDAGFSIGIGSGEGFQVNQRFQVKILKDQSILISAQLKKYNLIPTPNIVKLRPDGQKDPNFSFNYLSQTLDPLFGMYMIWISNFFELPDGKILLLGQINAHTNGNSIQRVVARMLPNGTEDVTFNPFNQQMVLPQFPYTNIVRQNDGKYLWSNTVGLEILNSNYYGKKIMRFNPDFSRDTTFHSYEHGVHIYGWAGGNLYSSTSILVGMWLQTDGKILVHTIFPPNNLSGIIRLNQDGTYDPSFVIIPYAGPIFEKGKIWNAEFQSSQSLLFHIGKSVAGNSIQADIIVRYKIFDNKPLNSNLVSGKIYQNLNNNCIKESNEKLLANRILKTEPGSYYGMSDSAQGYLTLADSGKFEIKQLKNQYQGLLETQFCPGLDSGRVGSFGPRIDSTINGEDFSNTVKECSFLNVNVSSFRRRRCFRNTSKVLVTNMGYADAPGNTKVILKLPKFVSFISSSSAYAYNSVDSTYEFPIGGLAKGSSKQITFVDSVNCINGIMGVSQCTKAWVTPGNSCVPNSSNWDGVDLAVSAKCHNSKPRFSIKNSGLSMVNSRAYSIYVDSVLAYTNSFQLSAGNSMSITVPQALASQNVRLEVAQSAFHPTSTYAGVSISCGSGTITPGGSYFASSDESPVESIDCQPIRDSYDPNDKQVWPKGATNQGNVLPGRPFDYKIRFQNTGNDTAYQVTIIDTLDAGFDISTLELEGSSHPYTFKLSGKGRPVFTWIFQNINLPDSNSNKEGSIGYIDFKIRPKANLPLGTKLKNFADIYFDYNPAIRTNTTLNTLYVPTLTSGLIDSVEVVTSKKIVLNSESIQIYPNPTKGKFVVAGNAPSRIRLLSLAGKELQTTKVGTKHSLDISKFGAGMYLIEVEASDEKFVKKIVVE